jgi:hypothetical protein
MRSKILFACCNLVATARGYGRIWVLPMAALDQTKAPAPPSLGAGAQLGPTEGSPRPSPSIVTQTDLCGNARSVRNGHSCWHYQLGLKQGPGFNNSADWPISVC